MSDIGGSSLEDFIQAASTRLQLPRAIYLRIAKMAVLEGQKDMAELEQAVAGEDLKQIQAISHRLKGAAANLGLDMVALPATEMNNLSKGPENMARIKELSAQIKQAFEVDLKGLSG
ncbi:MAG: Hpt domain-containing protein [Candidatus Omnitrophica bacterium]|nr:Hpt domain-containing protein [Candidatus Omnitrophota bacterium]